MRCLEAGQGLAVVVLHDAGAAAPSALEVLLAEKFRVIALECPGLDAPPQERPTAIRDAARRLARAALSLGLDHYVLVSYAHTTALALWQGLEDTAHVDALVLISPAALLDEGEAASGRFLRDAAVEARLGDMTMPTLVLIGTNDTTLAPTTGQTYVERIPGCYYMLVYDAGLAMETERPAAVFEAVSDFAERGGLFIVERNASAINP
jgi:pimeloyl-ACP methyl ester carboxylesterase